MTTRCWFEKAKWGTHAPVLVAFKEALKEQPGKNESYQTESQTVCSASLKKNNKKRLLSLLLLLKNEDLIKEKVNLCQLIHKGILKHLFMHVEPSAAKWISDNYITLVFLVFSWAAGYVKFNVSVWICLSHGCFLFSFSDSDKNSSLSLCKRYKTPECDADARSYVADPEDPFHVRPLQGSLSLSHHVDSLWRNFTSWNFRPDMETK